jgi:hypothetical protein
MGPKAKVLLVEAVIPDDAAPSLAKLLDLEMLVMTSGGRERTKKQFDALFRAAGLRLARIVPTAAEVSIIEGRPA